MTGLTAGLDLGVRKEGLISGLSNWMDDERKVEIHFWESSAYKWVK